MDVKFRQVEVEIDGKKETVERVSIHSDFNGKDTVDRVATAEDRTRFADEYAAFKASLAPAVTPVPWYAPTPPPAGTTDQANPPTTPPSDPPSSPTGAAPTSPTAQGSAS